MARGYSRNPYSSYSGYRPGSTAGSVAPGDVPADYPVKDKQHSSAQHLELLQKYHDEKRKEHGAVWRPSEQYHKDVALNQALAHIERVFPKSK